MLPIHQEIHVNHHLTALTDEARAERLAAEQRRSHSEEHQVHPTLIHDHGSTGVRGTVGRLLIGLGTVIAGDGAEAGARPAA